jgi:hypothetical protein
VGSVPDSRTQNADYSTTQTSKRAHDTSAEWIVEAPAASKILHLADFGVTRLTSCTATIDGREGAIGDPAWRNDVIAMQAHKITKAVTSPLGRDGSSFSVTWAHE